jgi:hypothetical protein
MIAMAPETSAPSTFPPSATFVAGALEILEGVEALGPDAAGALCFGASGVVLVEAQEISWATAVNMQHRLMHRLRRQRNPPLDRRRIERVFESCRETRTPVREALVASGLLSEAGVRAAFYRHTVDAIGQLARERAVLTEFVAYESVRRDARFRFTPASVLAGFGARVDQARAAAARFTLGELPEAIEAVAFDTEPAVSIIAVSSGRALAVRQVLEAASHAAQLLSIDRAGARCDWHDERHLLAWRSNGISFAAICTTDQLRSFEAIGARSAGEPQ